MLKRGEKIVTLQVETCNNQLKTMGDTKKRLLGMTLSELKTMAADMGMPAFTGRQIAQWLYEKHVGSIDEMTNLSKQNRERLEAEYEVGRMEAVDCQRSSDGTVKYLFPVRKVPSHPEKGQGERLYLTSRVAKLRAPRAVYIYKVRVRWL